MDYILTNRQQAALVAIHDLYRFTRPGRALTKSEMVDLLLMFTDKFENEFEEFVAGAYDARMAHMIDSHIMREPE